ncbi:MAG: FtsX-like permease family protein [Promethearchaeota archaeon]
MSFNFAFKDIANHGPQTKSYVKVSVAVTALAIFFLNLIYGLGLLFLPSTVSVYTYTLLELNAQYNGYLVILTFILVIFIMLTQNHAIILARKKDIAIMKAMGTYPRQLYSFYMTEILLLVVISYISGLVIGYGLFIVANLFFPAYFVLSMSQVNLRLTGLLLMLLLLFTYLINGWEIRRIGLKTYAETIRGPIGKQINVTQSHFWQKILFNRSPTVKLAFNNLLRKTYAFRENLVLITITGMILLTSITGVLVIDSSSQNYIRDAQGQNLIAIGATPVIDSYSQAYTSFASADIPDLTIGNFTAMENNLVNHTSQIETFLQTYQISRWEQRLYSVETIFERSGYVITDIDTDPYVPTGNETDPYVPTENDTDPYVTVGTGTGNRTVPVQGVNFGETLQSWSYEGAILNFLGGAVVGDTLAGELFENAYLQKLTVYNRAEERQSEHHIHAVVIDPLNNGNSVYMPLMDLQSDLSRYNYTNLMLVDYSPLLLQNQDLNAFKTALQSFLLTTLGEGFELVDLQPIFTENLQKLNQNLGASMVIGIIIAGVVIYVIFYYQQGRVHEDRINIEIFRAMGGTTKNVRHLIFLEQFLTLGAGLLLAFIGTLYVMIFLLQDAYFPSIWLPLGVLLGVGSLLTILNRVNSVHITQKYHSKISAILL